MVGLDGCAARSDPNRAVVGQAPAGSDAGATATVLAAPAGADAQAAGVQIVSAQFGVFGADPLGRRFLYETDHFPAVISAPFGWYITFKTDRPTVIWREEFELPEEPPTWGPGEAIGAFRISPDRRTAVTERIIPARMGFVANEWRYAPGDPIGNHKMRVYIDGQLVRDFAFTIDKGPAQRDPDAAPGQDTARPLTST
jgi:hypothetical protein